jgi:anti-sigma B factor antagonist
MPEDFLPKPFRCEIERDPDVTRVVPHGDLDMSTAGTLEERLMAVREGGARRVVVDLRRLDFMDSTGLTLMTRWNNESQRDGFEFALVAGDARIQRLFDLTGLTEYLTFVDG